MLLAYDAAGTVVYQLGTNPLMPDGPPDEALPALFAEARVAPRSWLRLNDVRDAALVAQVLARGCRVVSGRVQLLDELAQVAPSPASVPDGATATGSVEAIGPPMEVTLSTGERVQAGRAAGYTPEPGHLVKLTRLMGQWVVDDRVLLIEE